MTNPEQTDPEDHIGPSMPDEHPSGPRAHASRRTARPPATTRLVLLALSMGGSLAALVLWATGHGGSSIRVLAGDVVLIAVLLLA